MNKEDAIQAQAAAQVYRVLARVFAAEPTERAFEELVQAAHLLGCDEFTAPWPGAADASAAFCERFIVPRGRMYVPLSENCITAAYKDDSAEQGGAFRWGACSGSRIIHVAECYRAAGFNPEQVRKMAPSAAALRDDSLAMDLVFLAFLATCHERALEQEHAAEGMRMWQEHFLSDHLLNWVGKAADILARADNDVYARAAQLVEAWCKLDLERVRG